MRTRARMLKSIGILLASIVLSIQPCAGQMLYTAQSRTLSCYADSGSGPNLSQSASASGFGPFTRSVGVSSTVAGGGASQNSFLYADGFNVSGSCGAGGMNAYVAQGQTVFDISFRALTATRFSFAASGSWIGNASGSITITENGLSIYNEQLTRIVNPRFEGTMLAGATYHFQLQAGAITGNRFGNSMDYSATWTAPSPGGAGVLLAGGVFLSNRRRGRGTVYRTGA